MSRKFVSDPREVVTSGQVVRVKVMEVDEARKRISLTLRLDDEPGKGGASGSKPKPENRGRADRDTRRPERTQSRNPAPAGGAMAEALRRAGLGS
jgi:uncharacterized protein